MKTLEKKIRIKTLTPTLGSLPGNKEILRDYIASKAETVSKGDEEAECILSTEEEVAKLTTVFPRDERGLFVWDYQLKGFFKEAIGVLVEHGDIPELTKWTYKRAVDCCLFIEPRRSYFTRDGAIVTAHNSICERTLRADTPQGERISIARSEQIDEGVEVEFSVELLLSSNSKSKWRGLSEEVLESAIAYGKRKGLGQWRNAGFGRFEVVTR